VATARRLPVPAVVGVVLVAVGIFLRDGKALACAVPLLLYGAAWLIGEATVVRRPLRVVRTPSALRIEEGREVSVSLVVSPSGGGRRRILLGCREGLPRSAGEVDGRVAALGLVRAGDALEVTYRLTLERGEHVFPGVSILRVGLIPTFCETVDVAHETRLLVVPRPQPIASLEIRPRRTRVYSGIVKARVGGPGLEFFGCRGYEAGDDVRRINWRAYAKGGELVVNEFEQERIADVNVILDARDAAYGAGAAVPLFESSVRGAATMAGHFLDRGNNVGLLVYGDVLDWTYPGFGRAQKQRVLNALARAEPRDKPAFADLRDIPARLFPSRSQLVFVSPLAGTDDVRILGRLRARGYHVIVLSPSALNVEVAQCAARVRRSEALELGKRLLALRRRLLLRTLAGLGVVVIDWDVSRPVGEAVFPVAMLLRGGRSP